MKLTDRPVAFVVGQIPDLRELFVGLVDERPVGFAHRNVVLRHLRAPSLQPTLSVSSNLKIHNMERVIGSCSDGAMVEDEVVVGVQLQL